MSTNRIGARQSGDLNGRLSKTGSSIKVVIVVDEQYSRFVSTQHLVWMIINLLSRQPDEICHIDLVLPDEVVASSRLSPLVANGPFHVRVFEAARGINPALNVGPCANDAIFVRVGPGELDTSRFSLSVSCDNWSGYVGRQPVDVIADSTNPIGPYVAACLVAGEIFKFARKMKDEAGSSPQALWLNAYTLRIGENVSYSPPLPETILFPSTALVGVGAVGSAFLHVLYTLPGWQGQIDIVDGDPEGVTETNLNRYALFDLSHIAASSPKASTASALFSATNMKPFDLTWQEWRVLDHPIPQIVISAVDNNIARHAIQDSMPNTILGASTNEMKLQVNYFGVFDSSSACLKCRNAIETRTTPDDVIIGRLKALHEEDLAPAAQQMEVETEDLKVYLSDPNKNCGLISGTSLQRFAGNSDTGMWSVGFVSVIAGVLLAAEFLKQTERADVRMDPFSNMFRFQFWHPTNAKTNRLTSAQPDVSCICRSSYYQAAVANLPTENSNVRAE